MRLTGFQGQSAVVTGAAGGIGRALVDGLAHAGARVMATDTQAALEGCDDIAPSDQVVWRALDVRDRDAAAGVVAEAADLHGPLSLAVHAAGVLSTTPILDLPPEEWQRLIDINAGGTLNMLSLLGQAMVPQGRGAIVVIGSNAAGVPAPWDRRLWRVQGRCCDADTLRGAGTGGAWHPLQSGRAGIDADADADGHVGRSRGRDG